MPRLDRVDNHDGHGSGGYVGRLFRTLKNPRRFSEISLCKSATPEWVQLLTAYAGFPFRPFSITLRSGPFEFQEKGDVATFWQVFFRNVYPVRPTDRLIVDADANIGAQGTRCRPCPRAA
jgi:hypothetical protein